MFIKLISILCVASIILGMVGVSIFMLRQRQQRHKPALHLFAQQLNLTILESKAGIEPFYDQLNNHFHFFQRGSNARIRALIQGNDDNGHVQVMIAALTHRGASQSFTDEYLAICWQDDRLRLPHFKLQPKGYAIERALNALLVGDEAQVSLSDFPVLVEHYQLSGPQPDAIKDHFSQGIGNYFNSQVQQSVYRSVEGHGDQFLFYTYLKKEIQADTLQQLYEESKLVLKLLLA